MNDFVNADSIAPGRGILSPDDPSMEALCGTLRLGSDGLGSQFDWPQEQLQACADAGLFGWFMPTAWGGQAWSEVDVIRGLLRLSQSCLTTTFIITQLTGACRRIVASSNESLKQRLLPDLLVGRSLATLGISHLTTSHQHLGQPVLKATGGDDGFVLEGFSPWLTGAAQADYLVTGATLEDQRQVLVVVATDDATVTIEPPASLVALSASQTGAVYFHRTRVSEAWVLAGPVENVMQQSASARTGGLQTSTLALGLARAALEFVQEQSQHRPELVETWQPLDTQWHATCQLLFELADGNCADNLSSELRARSNSLALRATQSALVVAKGAGFTSGHAAGRWCREALFFLVWSCPQTVLTANLCEFAGIA